METESKAPRLPRYERAEPPPPMRFGESDEELLKAILRYDGVLARRQAKTLFWAEKSERAMQLRLSRLYHNGYINWPSAHERRTKPIPEPIIWLGWKGALYLGGKSGLHIPEPKHVTANWKRTTRSRLLRVGVRWLPEPRWLQLEHDLAATDFRLQVERDAAGSAPVRLVEWMPEGLFRVQMDVVEYQLRRRDGSKRKRRRGVRPDGYFVLIDEQRERAGQPARLRFLVEIDRATHPNPRFGREKAIPGATYIQSKVYEARFGANKGQWLVVTTGAERMNNLMDQIPARKKVQKPVFLFTTFQQIADARNVLTDPIWQATGDEQPLALIAVGASQWLVEERKTEQV